MLNIFSTENNGRRSKGRLRASSSPLFTDHTEMNGLCSVDIDIVCGLCSVHLKERTEKDYMVVILCYDKDEIAL